MKSSRLRNIIAAVFIFLFVYTASSKLLDQFIFEAALQKLPVIGAMSKTVAWLVPAVELAVVAALAFPSTRSAGLAASLFLMTIFTGYLVFAIASQDDLPCSCGGVIRYLSWKQHLIFNAALMVLAFIGWRVSSKAVIPAAVPTI